MLKNYGNKSKKGKLIALCVKALTGALGATAIVSGSVIGSLVVLSVGAVVNEVINFYKWNDDEGQN